jgi:hypothetical protein
MRYIEAFSHDHSAHYHPIQDELSLFLAGGISGCPDWQREVAQHLAHTDLVILNPRRANFPMDSPDAAVEQIKWEFDHLLKATLILFWFPQETLCPITLFEYGKWLSRHKPLFVGCHPEYKRLIDVQTQTRLERPLQTIHTSLDTLVEEVVRFSSHTSI